MQTEFLLRPSRKLFIEILGGIGERSEDDDLAITRVEWQAALAFDNITQSLELRITRRAHLFCC